MAIQYPGFNRLETPDYSGFSDFFSNILKAKGQKQALERGGYENQIKAEEARLAPQTQQAALQKALLENKYYAPQAEADIAYKQMQNQFAGLGGEGKNALALEFLKSKVGEDSPLYQTAKAAIDRDIKNTESMIANRDMLTRTGDKRAAGALTKEYLELDDVNNGFQPGTNRTVQIDPVQQEFLRGQLENKIVKDTTDADNRSRVRFVNNVDTTLDSINVDDLVRYSGLAGGIQKKLEQGKSLSGKESDVYKRYEESKTRVSFLAKQARQFYGDSVQAAALESINELMNPEAWSASPAIAKAKFEAAKSLLKQEGENMRKPLDRKSVV